MAYPALMKVMQTTDFRARMDTARAELTTALFEAQKLGILVFEAAGNEYADAKRSGRPELSKSGSTGTRGLLRIGVGLATAANAKDANVTPAGITKLLTDPRAVHDIRGTERDGAGALDDFAAILLAANPKLERATIDRAWKMLGAKDADVPAVKRLLGLR